MSQRKGLYSILEIPLMYEIVQKVFTHNETMNTWFKMVENHKDKVVLDIGCGPGKDSQYFGKSKKYVGLDLSEKYIESAKKNYASLGEFYCLSVEEIEEMPIEEVDIVIMKGVFHHLSDGTVSDFLERIKQKLSNDGKIFSIDPMFIVRQNVSNFIVSLDRGMFVRSDADLLKLLSKHMQVESKNIIKQSFPPYQRILLQLGQMASCFIALSFPSSLYVRIFLPLQLQ